MVAQQFLLSCQSGLGIDGLIGYEQAMLNNVMVYQSLIDNRVGSVRGRPWEKTRATWRDVRLREFVNISPADFKRRFRVPPAMFLKLTQFVERHGIKRRDTRFRRAVPSDIIVAVCLRRLATGDSFFDLAHEFGVSVETARSKSNEFNAKIKDVLYQKVVKLPTGAELKRVTK